MTFFKSDNNITGGLINDTIIGGTTAASGTFTVLSGTTSLSTPSLDAVAAGPLLIGSSTATSIEIGDVGVTTDVQGPVTVASSIDTAGAAALLLGASNATSVEIADVGVTTDVQGPVTVQGSIDTNGAAVLTLGASNATSVEIADTAVTTDIQGPVTVQSSVDTAGAAALLLGASNATSVEIADATVNTDIQGTVTVQGSIDTNGAATLTLGSTNATKIELAETGVTTEVQGGLTIEGNLDTIGASALILGATNATSVEIADATVTTDIQGPVTVASDIDTAGAAVLTLGASNATAVEIADVGVNTNIQGSLTVDEEATFNSNVSISGNLNVTGTTTSTDSTNVLIADPHLYLNKNYTTTSGVTGGLVVNYLPTATVDSTTGAGVFTAGVAATSNPTVTTNGSATFAAADLIQINGATDVVNNGLFEVLSHVGTTLTIRGVGTTATVEDFTQNQFVASAGDTGATITKVTVSIIRTGADGIWETGSGSATPIVFTDLSTGISISGVDNQLVRMNGTNDIQNSTVTVDDSGNMTLPVDSGLYRSFEAVTTSTAGALTFTNNFNDTEVTFISTTTGGSGNVTATLGTPTVSTAGRQKLLVATEVDASLPIVITVSNSTFPGTSLASSNTLTFDTAGQSAHLIWSGSTWYIANAGASVN